MNVDDGLATIIRVTNWAEVVGIDKQPGDNDIITYIVRLDIDKSEVVYPEDTLEGL